MKALSDSDTALIDTESFRFHEIDRRRNHVAQFEKNAKQYNMNDVHTITDYLFMNSSQFITVETEQNNFSNREKYFKQRFRLR